MSGFLIGYHTGRGSPVPRRRPGPIAALFLLFVAACAAAVLILFYPEVFGPIVGILVLLVMLGALGQFPWFRC